MIAKEKIDIIKGELEVDIANITTVSSINDLKVKYLGKKSSIQELLIFMKDLSVEEKREFGKNINELKTYASELIESKKLELEKLEMNKKLENESVDVTLPGDSFTVGAINPLDKTLNEIEKIFVSMGYDVEVGPEVEKDLYNFEMLNLPKGHPARDAQDTFYITDEMLLRSQTSPVQVRTMLKYEGKEPIRIICPGKTYRRDDDDATHSHQFNQIEGLVVDKNISLADLKGTLDVFAKKIFGEDRETRFRPSYYPFTEPSVEYDVTCFKCGGAGCNICKGTGWITIMGAGVVHPNVLKMAGYDPEVWTGFAFGMGAERIAMLKYGITDIRNFYIHDVRALRQFDRLEGSDK